jgi:hypothetical protein
LREPTNTNPPETLAAHRPPQAGVPTPLSTSTRLPLCRTPRHRLRSSRSTRAWAAARRAEGRHPSPGVQGDHREGVVLQHAGGGGALEPDEHVGEPVAGQGRLRRVAEPGQQGLDVAAVVRERGEQPVQHVLQPGQPGLLLLLGAEVAGERHDLRAGEALLTGAQDDRGPLQHRGVDGHVEPAELVDQRRERLSVDDPAVVDRDAQQVREGVARAVLRAGGEDAAERRGAGSRHVGDHLRRHQHSGAVAARRVEREQRARPRPAVASPHLQEQGRLRAVLRGDGGRRRVLAAQHRDGERDPDAEGDDQQRRERLVAPPAALAAALGPAATRARGRHCLAHVALPRYSSRFSMYCTTPSGTRYQREWPRPTRARQSGRGDGQLGDLHERHRALGKRSTSTGS